MATARAVTAGLWVALLLGCSSGGVGGVVDAGEQCNVLPLRGDPVAATEVPESFRPAGGSPSPGDYRLVAFRVRPGAAVGPGHRAALAISGPRLAFASDVSFATSGRHEERWNGTFTVSETSLLVTRTCWWRHNTGDTWNVDGGADRAPIGVSPGTNLNDPADDVKVQSFSAQPTRIELVDPTGGVQVFQR